MRFTEKQVFDCWQRAQLKTDPGTKDTIDCLTDELNLLLDEWLKAAPVVNCQRWTEDHETGWYRGKGTDSSTHTARLACIEPLTQPRKEKG